MSIGSQGHSRPALSGNIPPSIPSAGAEPCARLPVRASSPIHMAASFAPWFLAGLAGLAVLHATRWGPWAMSDATEYIISARNLLEGHGLGLFAASGRFMPLSLHPPLYPLVLAALGVTGLDLVLIARWLDAFLFGAIVFLAIRGAQGANELSVAPFAFGLLVATAPLLLWF